jgi:hypothetical protein
MLVIYSWSEFFLAPVTTTLTGLTGGDRRCRKDKTGIRGVGHSNGDAQQPCCFFYFSLLCFFSLSLSFKALFLKSSFQFFKTSLLKSSFLFFKVSFLRLSLSHVFS